MVDWDYEKVFWIRCLLIPVGIVLIFYWFEFGLYNIFGATLSAFVILLLMMILYVLLIFVLARKKNI